MLSNNTKATSHESLCHQHDASILLFIIPILNILECFYVVVVVTYASLAVILIIIADSSSTGSYTPSSHLLHRSGIIGQLKLIIIQLLQLLSITGKSARDYK